MNIIKTILPHIIVILAGIFIVLLILDDYNPTMNFINNTVSMKLFWVFCILSIINAALLIVRNRKEWRTTHKTN
jgi:hypothetical protein